MQYNILDWFKSSATTISVPLIYAFTAIYVSAWVWFYYTIITMNMGWVVSGFALIGLISAVFSIIRVVMLFLAFQKKTQKIAALKEELTDNVDADRDAAQETYPGATNQGW